MTLPNPFSIFCRKSFIDFVSILEKALKSTLLGGSYTLEHGNQLIFAKEDGKIVYILVDFGKKNIARHWNVLFWGISNGNFETIRTEIGNHTPREPPLLCWLVNNFSCCINKFYSIWKCFISWYSHWRFSFQW